MYIGTTKCVQRKQLGRLQDHSRQAGLLSSAASTCAFSVVESCTGGGEGRKPWRKARVGGYTEMTLPRRGRGKRGMVGDFRRGEGDISWRLLRLYGDRGDR